MPSMGGASNQVRIIGGQWRGRKLAFPDSAGLRPTSDRMRETLFNWLAPVIEGTECLDLFAGSGALGFEAASRGAGHVLMVERDPRVLRALDAARQRLAAGQMELVGGLARDYLAGTDSRFDIVFLDPPFGVPGLLEQSMSQLAEGRHLKQGAFVYTENPAGAELPPELPGWALHKEKRAGAVRYRLYCVALPERQGG